MELTDVAHREIRHQPIQFRRSCRVLGDGCCWQYNVHQRCADVSWTVEGDKGAANRQDFYAWDWNFD